MPLVIGSKASDKVTRADIATVDRMLAEAGLQPHTPQTKTLRVGPEKSQGRVDPVASTKAAAKRSPDVAKGVALGGVASHFASKSPETEFAASTAATLLGAAGELVLDPLGVSEIGERAADSIFDHALHAEARSRGLTVSELRAESDARAEKRHAELMSALDAQFLSDKAARESTPEHQAERAAHTAELAAIIEDIKATRAETAKTLSETLKIEDLIKESQEDQAPCDYDHWRAADGSRCGRRSAQSRPGGRNPALTFSSPKQRV